ncbi:hypothetical protein [Promicromonospora sukumoe]|uniref:hypothetical protein n=1 Tax=Promicromonospora sukumoe TaxID=88382 RepID=UPI00035D7005|nr:hypothetical protein [Promicromonospora sukumoe]
MAMADKPRKGFWYQVGRPFRAIGRGMGRVLEALDFFSLIAWIVRGVAWVIRGIGRAFSDSV